MSTLTEALVLKGFDGRNDELHGCRLCNLSARERTVHRSVSATAVPSLGAFIAGWTLVVPRRHVLALAELDPYQWMDFADSVEHVRAKIEKVYGDVVAFEHGSAGPNRAAGCGVDHAHLHLVPTRSNIRRAIESISADVGSFAWERASGQPERREALDYLYVADATGEWISYSASISSQVVRRALAAENGRAVWDWKQDHCEHVVEATIKSLVEA